MAMQQSASWQFYGRNSEDELTSKRAVWIDFENAPHVWVLSPIIRHLTEKGHPVILTARDFSCTVGLSHRLGYQVQVIGQPGTGKYKAAKAFRIMERALRLYLHLSKLKEKISLAVSHGSRSQILAAHFLGLPVVSLDDYEFSDQSLVRFVNHLLVPFPIPKETWGKYSSKVSHYPGLKEELYLCNFKPSDDGFEMVKKSGKVKMLFRPEGRFAHYRSEQTRVLQDTLLDSLEGRDDVFLVLLPRDEVQSSDLKDFCERKGIDYWIPSKVVDGPSLIWNMDLMVSGGGTMTREAAVMGVPSYSFFGGKWGAVDRYLESYRKLFRISGLEDVEKISLKKNMAGNQSVATDGLKFVREFIENAAIA
jgi:uncharacterized protein